jgi:hypothetical protein
LYSLIIFFPLLAAYGSTKPLKTHKKMIPGIYIKAPSSVCDVICSDQVMKHPSVTPSSSLRTALFTLFVDPPMEAQWKGVENLSLLGTLGPFSSMHFVGPCFCLGEAVLEGPELLLSFIYPSPLFSREQIFDILKQSAHLLEAESATKI